MKKIFKYNLPIKGVPIKGTQLLSLPKNSQVLSVGNQRENLVLWAAVDTVVKETEQHLVTIATTGSPLPEVQNADFLGTVLFGFGHDAYVVHVFHEKV